MSARPNIKPLLAAVAVVGASCASPGLVSDESANGDPETPAAEQLECFDADYPIEPTFTTPEEALEHALETETADLATPRDLDAYDKTERAEGWVDFVFRESADVHHTWGAIRDEDDKWGIASLGGCFVFEPSRPWGLVRSTSSLSSVDGSP